MIVWNYSTERVSTVIGCIGYASCYGIGRTKLCRQFCKQPISSISVTILHFVFSVVLARVGGVALFIILKFKRIPTWLQNQNDMNCAQCQLHENKIMEFFCSLHRQKLPKFDFMVTCKFSPLYSLLSKIRSLEPYQLDCLHALTKYFLKICL